MSSAAASRERDTSTREIGKAVKHGFIYSAAGMVQKGVSFLLLPFYTHYLNPSDFGIIEILTLITSLLGMFLSFGISSGVLRYYGSADTEAQKRRIVSTASVCVGLTGVAIFAIGSLLIRPASRLLLGPTVPATYLMLMFVFFIMGYVNTVPSAYLRAREASGTLVTIDTGGTICITLLSAFSIAVLKLSVLGILLSQVLVMALITPFLVLWTLRQVGVEVDAKLFRSLVSFGSPLIMSNLALFSMNFSDRFFLQRFSSLDVVGVYSVGYKFAYMINFLVIQPFNMMWMARMYQIQQRSDSRNIFKQVFILYSVLLLVVGLGIALFATELVRGMTDARYVAGSRVVPPVVLAYVFLGLGSYLQLGTFLAYRTGLIGIVSLVAGVFTLGLNYFLIPQYGMMGAAWATALGFLTLAAGSYLCSQRVYQLDFGAGRVLLAFGLAIATFFASGTIHFRPWWTACFAKVGLLAGFIALLPVLGVISRDDLYTLKSLASGAASAWPVRQRQPPADGGSASSLGSSGLRPAE